MRKASLLGLACLLIAGLAGCQHIKNLKYSPEERALIQRYKVSDYPPNPIRGLHKVGVVVLDASVDNHPDVLEFTRILSSEIQQVQGMDVIPDRIVLAVMERDRIVLPRDGLRLADSLGADGVFVGIVTDYSPYGQPMIAMAVTLFSRVTAPIAPIDLDRVVQGGRPLTMPTDPSIGPVLAVTGVFDSQQQQIRNHLQWYAAGRTAEQVGYGWERYYRSMPNYERFVSYEMVWKIFDRLEVEQGLTRPARP
jgi:hypothetical protein